MTEVVAAHDARVPRVGTARVRASVRSRDRGGEEGLWQSGSLLLSNGTTARFIALGIRLLPAGSTVEVEVHREVHPQYGEQLVVDRCWGVESPATRADMEQYLAGNVEGMGKQYARRIVSVCGLDVVRQLDADPELLARLVPGRRGRELVLGWRRWQADRAANERAANVEARLVQAGVGYATARRIISFFRSADVAEICLLHRPYRLLDVPGFSWERADRIARQLGVAATAPDRLHAALVVALEDAAAEGHSALPMGELVRRAGELVGGAKVARTAVESALEAGLMVESGGLVYLPRALDAEVGVALHLRRRAPRVIQIPATQWEEVERLIAAAQLSTEQAAAVRAALTRGVLLVTGGPGTGKTTTVRTIVAAAKLLGLTLKLVAPTGKAAARAAEAAGVPAETVHRLIGERLGVRLAQRLPLDLVILDEASMASVEVLAWLLLNLQPTTRVLIVGDPAQLPSVDHGAALRDLLRAGTLPTARLTAVFRQAAESGIVVNAYRVLRGEPMRAHGRDFELHDVTDRRIPGAAPDLAWEKAAARARLGETIEALARGGTDLTTGVQVLTPMNKDLLGVDSLNHYLQQLINPMGQLGPEIGGGRRVRVGDRVSQTRNDYELALFNGEQGVVTDVGPDRLIVLIDPRRSVEVMGYRLLNLRLAWAITVHRAQGSEWDTVIGLFHRSHGLMLSRELLYTGLTRAKTRFILITDEVAQRRICEPDANERTVRWTGLAHRLAARGQAA